MASRRGITWAPPPIPKKKRYITSHTPAELRRLKDAWSSKGSRRGPLAAIVRSAEAALKEELFIPPRGGQHNQWYQCDKCQLPLRPLSRKEHKCDECGKVYTDGPQLDASYNRINGANLAAMLACARAWTLTGRKEFLRRGREVLLGYAAKYLTYELHSPNNDNLRGSWSRKVSARFDPQTLGESQLLVTTIAPAYELLRPKLTADERRLFLQKMVDPLVENVTKNPARKSNWQTWHNAAFFCGGALLGRQDWMRRSIEDSENGFAFQMRESVGEDGFWFENSWGYHFYTLSGLVHHAEAARRCGMDLWSHPALRRMIVAPLRFRMPNGSLPRTGDAKDVDALPSEPAVCGFAATGDGKLRAALPKTHSWNSIALGVKPVRTSKPPSHSDLMLTSGYAILRSPSTQCATSLCFAPDGGFHTHMDKLSFVYFSQGVELGIDPGMARSQAYRLPVHSEWFRASIAHNTVMVDGADQEPCGGMPAQFQDAGDFAIAGARCSDAYKGVQHDRTTLLTPEYLLVLDELISTREQLFEWLYHNAGTTVRSSKKATQGRPFSKHDGWSYVKKVQTGRTNEDLSFTFSGAEQSLRLTVAGAAGTRFLTGFGPFRSIVDLLPMVSVARRGKRARFAALLEPLRPRMRAPRSRMRVNHGGGATTCEIRRGKAIDVLRLGSDTASLVRNGEEMLIPEEGVR